MSTGRKQFEIVFEDGSCDPALSTGEMYTTSATNGAGLVCDVYDRAADQHPKATFARVRAVRTLGTPTPYSVTGDLPVELR